MISKFFIDRPIFANVLAILTVLGGLVAMFTLPISQYPEIVPPTVWVTTQYPGADPQVVADTVAAPIELQVNGVDKMMYMSSNCNKDGSYNLTVTFELGTDPDMNQVLVQNRVNIATPRLPNEVKQQGVVVKKKTVNFVTISNLSSPDGRYDSLYLANYAIINLQDALARVPGVGDVKIFPLNKDYSMRIWLDPEKLESRNLTTNDVVNALQEQNVQVAAGQIGQPPAPKDQIFQYTVTTLGRLKDVSQFEDIILKATPGEGGRITRVRDVARVELGGMTYDTTSYLNGAPACTIIIYQLSGANALQVCAGIRRVMAELEKDFPEGVKYSVRWDVSDVVYASIEEIAKTLVAAFILVAIVIFIFLGNLRTSMIPITTVPVSIIGAFLVMAGLGFSINVLTLFGLVLAIGIVVDDAIVVTENAQRVMDEEGLPPREATIKAMEEITGPVIGITLVLMSVFLPTAFLPGITGQMYRQFALTIAGTTAISAINALTLKPAQCALFLKPRTGRPNLFVRGFNRAFDGFTGVYRWILVLFVRRAVISLILYVGLVALAGAGFFSLPTGFIPMEDQGIVHANIQLPSSASMSRNDAAIAKTFDAAKKVEGVADTILIGGFSLLDGTYASDVGFGFIALKPWDERYSWENMRDQNFRAIILNLRSEFAKIQDGVVVAFPPPPILGLGAAGGFQMQVLDKGSLGLDALAQSAADLAQEANTQSGLTNVNMRFRAKAPQLFADVDRVKAKTLDIPLQWVFNTMQAYLGSTYVNDFNLFGRTDQVRVQADSMFRARVTDFNRLYVRNNSGQMVPLTTLMKVEDRLGPPYILRFNLYPTVPVNGEAAPGKSSGQALALMEQIADQRLPTGIGYAWTDMAFQEKRVGNTAIFALILAVTVVYLVLAAQYESWSNPFAVILAVPTALVGAAAALYIRNMDVNLYTQIGLVLLVALSAKNAILIVEFARDARAAGASLFDAAVNGAKVRFRPILMTSFAFNLGVFPLVIAMGAGAASRRALGTAVFGGMLAATIFPVFFVPVFYVIVQGLSEWLGKGKAPANAQKKETP
ncbi:MAG: multidrug efflux RND transporter permease subunit [Planctomycetota bacterium]